MVRHELLRGWFFTLARLSLLTWGPRCWTARGSSRVADRLWEDLESQQSPRKGPRIRTNRLAASELPPAGPQCQLAASSCTPGRAAPRRRPGGGLRRPRPQQGWPLEAAGPPPPPPPATCWMPRRTACAECAGRLGRRSAAPPAPTGPDRGPGRCPPVWRFLGAVSARREHSCCSAHATNQAEMCLRVCRRRERECGHRWASADWWASIQNKTFSSQHMIRIYRF